VAPDGGHKRWSKSAPNLEKRARDAGHLNIATLQEIGTHPLPKGPDSNFLNNHLLTSGLGTILVFTFYSFINCFDVKLKIKM